MEWCIEMYNLRHNGQLVIYKEMNIPFLNDDKKEDLSIDIHPTKLMFLRDLELVTAQVNFLNKSTKHPGCNFWFEPVFEKVVADV